MRSTTTTYHRTFLLRSAVPSAVLVATLLAACGSNDPDTGKDDVSPTGSSSASVAPGGPEDLVPSRPPTTKDGVVSIQGTVGVGVEPGCVILTNAGGTYTLLGGKVTTAQAGQDVVVTGTVSDGASTCQQGTLLEVSEVLTR